MQKNLNDNLSLKQKLNLEVKKKINETNVFILDKKIIDQLKQLNNIDRYISIKEFYDNIKKLFNHFNKKNDLAENLYLFDLINKNRLTFPCPFTSVTISSNVSFCDGIYIFYKFIFDSNDCYLIMARFNSNLFGIYLPFLNLVILHSKRTYSGNILSKFYEFYYTSEKIRKILENNEKKQLCLLTGYSDHLGHYILNELSLINDFFDSGLLSIENIIQGPHNFFDLNKFFEMKKTIYQVSSFDEINNLILKENFFIFSLKRGYYKLNLSLRKKFVRLVETNKFEIEY